MAPIFLSGTWEAGKWQKGKRSWRFPLKQYICINKPCNYSKNNSGDVVACRRDWVSVWFLKWRKHKTKMVRIQNNTKYSGNENQLVWQNQDVSWLHPGLWEHCVLLLYRLTVSLVHHGCVWKWIHGFRGILGWKQTCSNASFPWMTDTTKPEQTLKYSG